MMMLASCVSHQCRNNFIALFFFYDRRNNVLKFSNRILCFSNSRMTTEMFYQKS
jgi:hypothetical protein